MSAANSSPSADRNSASFHDTLWGDRFLNKVDEPLHVQQGQSEYEALKEEVRKMVTPDGSTAHVADDGSNKRRTADKLRLIDAIQQLGVGYHFETEIDKALEEVQALGDKLFIVDGAITDLYHEALRFRLLRQQGLLVSSDGFKTLKDGEGRFKASLASDEQGLLSLYEAAHVALNGEGILDEALTFATKTLKSILPHQSPSFHKQVQFALRLPIWKCVPRSLTRHYIDIYSEDASHNERLLVFAKLDFNMLQNDHQQELREVSRWWESLNVTVNFPYARDRVVECYYWIYAVYFEPKYHLARMIIVKIISLLSLLDDTYDNFGTHYEVEILTAAIQRFNVSALEELPDAMKNMYRLILNVYDEIEMELAKAGPTFAADYAREELKKLCRSHLTEIQWRTKGHAPTLEEYKAFAYITSCCPILCTSAFVGMGTEIATKEAFQWVTNESNKMVRAGSIIFRLQNDIVSHKFEQNRKHAASAVECYVNEHMTSEQEAVEFLWAEISKAWKDIAEECQKPTLLSVALTDRVLNFARSISVIYEKEDGYTNSYLLKAHLGSLFVDPIPL
ncbi:unnamed protein product [Linum tenue]|uniref:Uncharacterized protein n=1 Tax=Linum tenue TaxID=586396 RepID=A0AAV0HSE7_9ROSI|nr:unnamed protein product [Linum tenue]